MKAINVFGFILLIGACIFGVWLRFANAHLTETQLFLNLWPEWLLIGIVAIIGGVMTKIDGKGR